MSSNERGIIEFEINVTVKASEQTKETIKQLERAKELMQSKTGKISKETKQNNKDFFSGTISSMKDDEFFKGEEEEIAKEEMRVKKETIDFLNKLDSKGLQTLSSFATNPTSAMLNSLSTVLSAAGADAAMFASIVGIAIATPIVIQQLIKALSVKGGPINRDFVSYLDKRIDVGLSREQVKQRQAGNDIVIIAQRNGFVPNNANWTYNSLYAIDDKRIQRIGLSDRAAGVISI